MFKNSDKTVVGVARAGGPQDGIEDFDLLIFYRKIKIMQYLKNKMQGHPDLSEQQRDLFRIQFGAIDEAYQTLESTVIEIMKSLLNDQGTQKNIAWSNPSLIVKIVRIMEFESKFV